MIQILITFPRGGAIRLVDSGPVGANCISHELRGRNLIAFPKFTKHPLGFGVRPKCDCPAHVLHCKTIRSEGQSMCRRHHKVRARRLARSISFNKRLAFRARSRFGPGGGGSSLVSRREYTSQAVWCGSSALVFNSLPRAFLITADFVVFLRRTTTPPFRVQSECNRLTHVLHRKTLGCLCEAGVARTCFRSAARPLLPRKSRGLAKAVRAR